VQKIINFFKHSWESDRLAFIVETIGFICVIGASFTLSITADRPNMSYIYPAFFVGNICSIIAYRRRRLAWQLLSAHYFFIINIFGFGRAVGWW